MKTRALSLAAALAFATAPALANPKEAPPSDQPASTAAGRALFDEGIKARDAQRWTDAIDKFKQSNEMLPSVGALLNIGDCYAKLGKLASADGAFRDAEALARKLKDTAREKVAKQRQEDIAPTIPRLVISATKTEGLVVKRDGKTVDPTTFDAAQPADSGSTTIEATAPGKKPFSEKVDLVEAKTSKVLIELEDAGGPPPPKVEPEESSSTQRTIGIGLEIGGGAVLALGLVFGGLTIGKWGSVKSACPDGHCQTRALRDANQADADAASTFAAISTVATIVGAAALAGGIVLHLTAPPNVASKTGVAIAPAVGQNAYGLSVTLSR